MKGGIAGVVERLGIMEAHQLRETLRLASPRIATGFAIMSKQTVDLAFVGIAVGTAGTAGLAFAISYWTLVVTIGLGIAGGTISLVSQHYGAERHDRASDVVRQSLLVAIVVSLPIGVAFALIPEELIAIFGPESASLREGSIYLFFVAPAVTFEFINLIGSRTYTGIGDSFTEMVTRGFGAVLNIVLSGVFIFGFGLGTAGAAIGTTVSTAVVMVLLLWGMMGGSLNGLGMRPSPVPVAWSRPVIDPRLLGQLVEISVPEVGRRMTESLVIFPLLWVGAIFGPVVVTALEVGRQIRALINSINWGMMLASSSLVGQELGKEREDAARAYGIGIIRLSTGVHIAVALGVIVLAAPIADVFVDDPAAVAQTAVFVVVAAVSSIGFGLTGAAAGALVGAGATRWPFAASVVGRYVCGVPAALLGAFTPLGIVGLYLALLLETFVSGVLTYALFRSERWIDVSRRYREDAEAHELGLPKDDD